MELRDYQAEAVAAIVDAVARGERRMSLCAACGTGKTLIAERAAEKLAPDGPVLVLMPTQALVTQTIARWREAGRTGVMVGACAVSQADSGLEVSEAVMTTESGRIAELLRAPGPGTVFATYASATKIQRAHEQHRLPAWDLIVIDEAHRTCGAFGEGWGTVHDDAALPAKTRLYMTATPRIWDTPAAPDLAGLMEAAPMATMDRQDIFGPTVFRLNLPQAIERGILADYQVLMPVIADQDLHGILADRTPGTSAHHNGLRMAAMHIAVLRAITEHDLRRVLVFHNRIDAAHAFATTLRTTAAQVPPPLQIPDLWAHAIDSDQSSEERRELLADFGSQRHQRAVLSNVRVINEGVDIPAIDAVVFADPRYSVIDAIQAIGRCLRQPPGSGKVATLVIPLYLPDGAVTPQALLGSDFHALWEILQALRAHDETFLDRIALPGRSRGGRTLHRRLSYSHPERAVELAAALGLEITLPATGTWHDGLHAATAYHNAFQHLDVPADYRDETGFALGEWTANYRMRRVLGRLSPEQTTALDALGMQWTPTVRTFTTMIEHLRGYARQTGHLAAPLDATYAGHRVGDWLQTLRRQGRRNLLPAEQEHELAAIDPCWNAGWQMWRRNYAKAHAFLLGTDESWNRPLSPNDPPQTVWAVRWLRQQARNFPTLERDQADLLLAIGIAPEPHEVYPGIRKGTERDFRDLLDAAQQFLIREWHLDVPAGHQEPGLPNTGSGSQMIALGEHLAAYRAEPGQLTAEQRTALSAYRMHWTAAPAPARASTAISAFAQQIREGLSEARRQAGPSSPPAPTDHIHDCTSENAPHPRVFAHTWPFPDDRTTQLLDRFYDAALEACATCKEPLLRTVADDPAVTAHLITWVAGLTLECFADIPETLLKPPQRSNQPLAQMLRIFWPEFSSLSEPSRRLRHEERRKAAASAMDLLCALGHHAIGWHPLPADIPECPVCL